MRLFYAINFSGAIKSKLVAVRDELQTKSVRGNFSATENLHLTLVFLGECDVKQMTAAKAVLDSLSLKPMDICIDLLGCFRSDSSINGVPAKSQDFVGKGSTTPQAYVSPSSGNEQAASVATWWAGLAKNKTLITLQQELTDKLKSAGFRLEKRKYSPHITLAREVVTDVHPWKIEPFGETVHSVDLMKSERLQGKLAYTAIHSKV